MLAIIDAALSRSRTVIATLVLILVSGIVAYIAANTPAILNMLYVAGPNGVVQPTGLAWIVMLSPFAFILALSFGINRMQASTAQAVFWAFSAVMGLSLANFYEQFDQFIRQPDKVVMKIFGQ